MGDDRKEMGEMEGWRGKQQRKRDKRRKKK